MADIIWCKLKSWHAVGSLDFDGPAKTRCGRKVPFGASVSATLPAGKSCENCLRIVGRQADV